MPTKFHQQFRKEDTGEVCHAGVYSLKWMGIELRNDATNDAARSYYKNFEGHNTSKFEIGIEFRSPEIIPSGDRRVMINWQNLLFTSSLLVQRTNNQRCRSYAKSYLGFVELIQTDTSWYKDRNTGMENKEWNLGKHPDLQEYVMTKPSQHAKYMFADNKATSLNPDNYDRIVPLKHESSENITIDFKQYPNTVEYERLVEKKVFIAQVDDLSGQVLKVVAGVDVMMYLSYLTYNVTDAVHLTLNRNHSLIQWIGDADKYTSVLNDTRNHKFRDRKLTYKSSFRNPTTTSLNPLLNGQNIIYTAK